MIVFVNDGRGYKLPVSGRPDGEEVGLKLPLNAGRNTIRLASRDKAPDVDYMIVGR